MGAAVITIAVVCVIALLGPTYPGYYEKLLLPLTSQETTFTAQPYACGALFEIEGTGQLSAAETIDAFYIYEQYGQPIKPPVLHQYLEIDGKPALMTIHRQDNPPPYDPEHRYQFNYSINGPLQAGFRVRDDSLDNNVGQFEITVIRSLYRHHCMLPYGG